MRIQHQFPILNLISWVGNCQGRKGCAKQAQELRFEFAPSTGCVPCVLGNSQPLACENSTGCFARIRDLQRDARLRAIFTRKHQAHAVASHAWCLLCTRCFAQCENSTVLFSHASNPIPPLQFWQGGCSGKTWISTTQAKISRSRSKP